MISCSALLDGRAEDTTVLGFTSQMTWETAGEIITTVGETIVTTLDFTGHIQVIVVDSGNFTSKILEFIFFLYRANFIQ